MNPITFTGTVIRGIDIGAKFGIATANLVVKEKLDLEEGVYFVQAGFEIKQKQGTRNKEQGIKGKNNITPKTPHSVFPFPYSSSQTQVKLPAIMHLGHRQTFGGEFSIEVHLLDFSEDLYDQALTIDVLKYWRPTKKFRNADLLFTQIENDIIKARKFFLRREIKAQWQKVTDPQKQTWAEQAVKQLAAIPEFQAAKNILAFAPMTNEIPYIPLLCEKFPEKEYYFPKIEKKSKVTSLKSQDLSEKFLDEEMVFYRSRYQDLEPGRWGILEPKEGTRYEIRSTNNVVTDSQKNTSPLAPRSSHLDIILVPALAATPDGHRLGRGAGFYDRFVSQHPDLHSICVLPEFAVRGEVPVEQNDKEINQTMII